MDNDILDFINQYNLIIHHCSYQETAKPNKSIGSFTSPFSRIIIMESGTQMFFVETKEYVLRPGNAYLIPSGLKLAYHSDAPFKCIGAFITLSGNHGHSFFSNLHQPVSTQISQEEIAEMVRLLNDKNAESALQFKSKLMVLFLSMFPEIEKSMYSTYSPIVKTAMHYMDHACSIKCTSKILSRDLNVSENTLAKKFREEVGVSLGKYNDVQVFKEAENMLLHSDWSLRQISDMLGFCDQFYFSRRFKQVKGMLPSEFRKRNKSNLYEIMINKKNP